MDIIYAGVDMWVINFYELLQNTSQSLRKTTPYAGQV